jgi:uncharacterized oxidoreductase
MEVFMKISGNTVLITGGATGIGRALAEDFLKEGNEVIICGRREERLLAARKRCPQLHVKVCDVAKKGERKSLLKWATSNFESLNILVNNAGIQREVDLTKGPVDLQGSENEIKTNLEAPIHLSALFVPHLMKRKEAAIINISSGLAFVPLAMVPVYCATKAALHSFTLSLRHQLSDTAVRVYEVAPPLVETELHKYAGEERQRELRGIPPEEVARTTMKSLEGDEFEIAVGMARDLRAGSRNDPNGAFKRLNAFP